MGIVMWRCVESFIISITTLINLYAYFIVEVFTLKKLKAQVAMDLRFDLRPGGPFVPPTMHRMPKRAYPVHEHDYDRAFVAHLRHEMAESPECERIENNQKKRR